jgi:prephenate dehydratase
VIKGSADGIVPIENSEAGGVGPTLDGLRSFRVFITGECTMPVHHNLASFVPIPEITVVYAHPQSHEQCSDFLDTLKLPVLHTSSNAASAVAMLKEKTAGAIVSRMTADLYRLPLVRTGIENTPDNTTRFIRISSRRLTETTAVKCSLIVDPSGDRPGLLHDILGVFALRGINLSRIESRPSKRGMGSYIFFIDIARTDTLPDALEHLITITHFTELGCYSTIEVGSWS